MNVSPGHDTLAQCIADRRWHCPVPRHCLGSLAAFLGRCLGLTMREDLLEEKSQERQRNWDKSSILFSPHTRTCIFSFWAKSSLFNSLSFLPWASRLQGWGDGWHINIHWGDPEESSFIFQNYYSWLETSVTNICMPEASQSTRQPLQEYPLCPFWIGFAKGIFIVKEKTP